MNTILVIVIAVLALIIGWLVRGLQIERKSKSPGSPPGFSWNEKAKLNKTVAMYYSGSLLLGQAAKQANMTTLEFMDYLSTSGFRSKYSFEDFQKAQKQLDKFLDYKPQ